MQRQHEATTHAITASTTSSHLAVTQQTVQNSMLTHETSHKVIDVGKLGTMQVHRAFKSNLVMIYLTSCKLTYATMLELMRKSLACRRQLHAACPPINKLCRAPLVSLHDCKLEHISRVWQCSACIPVQMFGAECEGTGGDRQAANVGLHAQLSYTQRAGWQELQFRCWLMQKINPGTPVGT